jgi:hypothetical protein
MPKKNTNRTEIEVALDRIEAIAEEAGELAGVVDAYIRSRLTFHGHDFSNKLDPQTHAQMHTLMNGCRDFDRVVRANLGKLMPEHDKPAERQTSW